MRSGFAIFLLEALVVLCYLRLTPTGPHRSLLWAIVVTWAVCAAVGLALAPVLLRPTESPEAQREHMAENMEHPEAYEHLVL